MRLKVNPEISNLLGQVQACLEPGDDLYLVGGGVRDLLMGCPPHDLDFVMPGDPTKLAKCVARRLDAGFFVLDDERHTSRVMYINPGGDLFPLDFIQFTGGSLEEDLRNRDFTINAMAISVNDLSTIIDPLKGQRDLEDELIRACTPTFLLDDPVRALRAVRLAVQLGFHMDAAIGELIRQAVQYLPRTSVERQRDELFRILRGHDPAQGMKYLYEYSLTGCLFPSLGTEMLPSVSQRQNSTPFENKLTVLKTFDRLLRIFPTQDISVEKPTLKMQEAVNELLPFKDGITAFFSEEITPGRKKRSLALLGVMLKEVDAEIAWEAARHLELSNAESAWIRRMVSCDEKLKEMVELSGSPDRRSIYWFFKAAEDAGVATTLLALTEAAGGYGEDLPEAKWHNTLVVSSAVLSAWFQQKAEVISPELLLDGHDLQVVFGLKPGRRIGKLLAALKESQASGEVRTKEEAQEFIREKLSNNLEKGDLG